MFGDEQGGYMTFSSSLMFSSVMAFSVSEVSSVTPSMASFVISSLASSSAGLFCSLAKRTDSMKSLSYLIFFSANCAAFCCDSFLEYPVPVPADRPSMSTSVWNIGL